MTGPNARHEDEKFSRSRVVAVEAGITVFGHVGETGSTNEDLVSRVLSFGAEPALLVADHQTAGRGRLDRRWEDIPGRQLLVSFVLPVLDREPHHLASAVAVACRAGLERLGVSVGLKWPNDLVIAEGPAPGKGAGLLSEFVAGPVPAVVIGLGLNVGPVPVDGATSLRSCGLVCTRDDVLASLLAYLPGFVADPAEVLAQQVQHSATIGQNVRVEMPAGEIIGTAVGIDPDGCLEVDDGTTVHRVAVGDVIHLRSLR